VCGNFAKFAEVDENYHASLIKALTWYAEVWRYIDQPKKFTIPKKPDDIKFIRDLRIVFVRNKNRSLRKVLSDEKYKDLYIYIKSLKLRIKLDDTKSSDMTSLQRPYPSE